MTKTIFDIRTTNPLIRLWHSTGEPGTPLLCNWVKAKVTTLRLEQSIEETGGSLGCR